MNKDQFIVEALGKCWHEWDYPVELIGFGTGFKCKKCKAEIVEWHAGIGPKEQKLDDWPGFGWLWERFQKHERWEEFLESENELDGGDLSYTFNRLINPLRFRDAVAEFFGYQEDK